MNKKKIEESKSEKIIKKKIQKKIWKKLFFVPKQKKDKPKMEMKFFFILFELHTQKEK